MPLLFGLELEGFYRKSGAITVPPETYPTDTFPGLVEIRTVGGAPLKDCYFTILKRLSELGSVDIMTARHVFTGAERAAIRERFIDKGGVSLRNIYGRHPKLLGNATIASLQINMSNERRPAYRSKEGTNVAACYGVFDFVSIIRNLDEEFSKEIMLAKRQPGCYAIKDDGIRVEYRSLPNFVFKTGFYDINTVISRIEKCVR